VSHVGEVDMNGIIHPCSHPENGPQPATEEDMYVNVCNYVDRLFRAIRPRHLLYLAIDGVAPRAKMNQQRARRFRSAQEARELAEIENSVRVEILSSNQSNENGTMVQSLSPPPAHHRPWDSNVITPGTPFMINLAVYLRFYIRKRIKEDRAWQNIKVIFSDASIPGEGMCDESVFGCYRLFLVVGWDVGCNSCLSCIFRDHPRAMH
jgi:5'-3' exoribonuclease 2